MRKTKNVFIPRASMGIPRNHVPVLRHPNAQQTEGKRYNKKMLLASVLLSLLGACIAHEDEPDGIDFLQKITENTIYKHRVKLLRPGSGCLCSVEKVGLRVYVQEQLSALRFISTCLSE